MRQVFFVLFLVLACAHLHAEEGGSTLRHIWLEDKGNLTFESEIFSARSRTPRGWVSIRSGDAEFLHSTDTYGGIVFRKGDTFTIDFPGGSNISHDSSLARQGSVVDGVFMIRIGTYWQLPDFEIYAGFNDKNDHDMILFPSDDVVAVRLGKPGTERNFMRLIVTPNSKPGDLTKSTSAVLVHRSGRAMIVNHALSAGVIAAPDGTNRMAVVIPCKGFAANSIECRMEPFAHPENFVVFPHFTHTTTAEPLKDGNAAHGVKSPIYKKGDTAKLGVEFSALGPDPFEGTWEVEIVHSLGQPHVHKRIPVKLTSAEGRKSFAADLEFSQPGVSDVWGRLLDKDDRLIWVDRYRMLYDVEGYAPNTTAPADMKEFWDGLLAEMRKIPLDAKAERRFEDHPDWEMYEVSFNALDNERVYAMLYIPKAGEKPMPAMVTSHPGTQGWGVNKGPDGVYGSKLKKDSRFVTIVPLIRGHKPDAKDIPFNNPWWGPLENRDVHAARRWFTTLVRAVDYLATRPDLVDMKRVVAKGGSQGGAFALVTAALDPRIAACMADSPSNCQLHEIVQNYPSFGPSAGQKPDGQSMEQFLKTLSYFDPVNMCPWIKCPTIIGLHVGDLTVHSMGGLAAYKNLTGLPEDQKGFYPQGGHYHANSKEGGRQMGALLEKIVANELTAPDLK